MKLPSRRLLLTCGLRLFLGVAIGWGLRLLYERRPVVRFAAGMAVRSVRPPESGPARGNHLRDGQPLFFSLNQIMAAGDPAAALRLWRQAFQRAPKEIQQRALQAPAEVSIGSLRQLIVQLSTSAALREEMNAMFEMARDLGADLYDTDSALRSLMELARLDPGLALDGAKAMGHDAAEKEIWALIAESDPQRVIDMVHAGQAPADALSAAVASLAARDLEKAEAVIRAQPADRQKHLERRVAEALARTRPLDALGLRVDGENHPDPSWADTIIRYVPGPFAIDFLLGIERNHPSLLQSCSAEISGLLGRQAFREPGFVFEWLERQQAADTSSLAHQFTSATIATLAAHDPARAAALLERFAGTSAASSIGDTDKSEVLKAWLRHDSMAAIQWVATQPDASSWLRLWNEKKVWGGPWPESVRPENAATLAHWLEEQGMMTRPDFRAAGALVKPWIQHDPAAAVAWATSLADRDARFLAVTAAAEALNRGWISDREAHLDALIQSSPDALGAVASRVDPKSLPLGERIADALPQLMRPGETAGQAISAHLAASLNETTSRQKTLQAVAALPDPAQRQQLLDAMAGHLDRKSPLALVRQLAHAMPDQESARRFLENTLRQRLER